MIAYLNGKLIEKRDAAVVIDVNGVGYEVACSARTLEHFGELGSASQIFVHTHYKADGVALFGFLATAERSLFLSLIKVDSVGPKSALNIMSAAPWDELVHYIEDGDVAGLSKLPKISKKTAELVVVKLKGKLGELLISAPPASASALRAPSKTSEARKKRSEAQTALGHLGYRPADVDRALENLDADAWSGDLQTVIRHALNDLSGNI